MNVRVLRVVPLVALLGLVFYKSVLAQDEEPISIEQAYYAIDNMILFIAAVLVLFMQAGFSILEAGFNQRKNTVNILFKNLMDLSLGAILFWFVGYNLMYPGVEGGFFAFGGFGIAESIDPAETGPGVLHPQADWLFQVAFAATAATIVSGAVAGRMKFPAYLIYSIALTAFIYPISGYWKWGGGWLHQMGFHDFAGSLVVHSVGGFAGLAGAIVLGPRLGRFEQARNPLPSHSIAIATLGTFILWVGWYGFNPGSQLAFSGSANVEATMLIAVNTTLAAGAGAIGAMIAAWFIVQKPDLGYALNGVLGGLVGITANCDTVNNISAMIIGIIAGMLVVIGMIFLERIRIDDTVGAWPVHGLCGVWGGLATAIFGGKAFLPQIVGSIAIPLWAFFTMLVLFLIMRGVGILRVSPEEEEMGLDATEHGMRAYAPPRLEPEELERIRAIISS
ncbi:MAG: ammonium transporter [Chloroflexota bacterium]